MTEVEPQRRSAVHVNQQDCQNGASTTSRCGGFHTVVPGSAYAFVVTAAARLAYDEGMARVITDAAPVAERLIGAGFRAYVVGGLVRDLMLGWGRGDTADVDMTTDALPADIKDVVAPIADDVWSQGERFGTIGCRVGGVEFEITTHRAERYEPGSRKPEVEFSTAIEADLSRRDFTVNAMAIAVPNGEIVDPFDGASDLAAGRLRTPDDPLRSFDDDPLRVLRAARFRARHDLVPVDELVDAARQTVDRLSIVSAERKRDELDKLLSTPHPSPGLELLDHIGVWPWVAPHLAQADVSAVASVVDSIDAESAGGSDAMVRARRAVVLGAITAAPVSSSSRTPSIEIVDDATRALRHSKLEQHRTRRIVSGVSMARSLTMDRPNCRRFLAAARDDLASVMAVVRAVDPGLASAVANEISALEEHEDISHFGPGLDGREIMAVLGEGSGPAIGEANAVLLEWRFEEGPLAPDELRRRLTTWARDRPKHSRR